MTGFILQLEKLSSNRFTGLAKAIEGSWSFLQHHCSLAQRFEQKEDECPTERASTVCRWAGAWYIGILRGISLGGGQEPEYLQPRIPQHSHLDVCFSSHPSGVPRPSGPAERGHRVGGLLPAVLTGQSSPGMYCAWAQCRARQDRVEAAAQKKSCYVADHTVRTHAMQRSMKGKCHVDRELERMQPWYMGTWSPMKGRRIALDETSTPLSLNGILGCRSMQ